MLGSLIMCTVYTNKVTFGQLKLRLGLYESISMDDLPNTSNTFKFRALKYELKVQ